jgi:hypothetical protein
MQRNFWFWTTLWLHLAIKVAWTTCLYPIPPQTFSSNIFTSPRMLPPFQHLFFVPVHLPSQAWLTTMARGGKERRDAWRMSVIREDRHFGARAVLADRRGRWIIQLNVRGVLHFDIDFLCFRPRSSSYLSFISPSQSLTSVPSDSTSTVLILFKLYICTSNSFHDWLYTSHTFLPIFLIVQYVLPCKLTHWIFRFCR